MKLIKNYFLNLFPGDLNLVLTPLELRAAISKYLKLIELAEDAVHSFRQKKMSSFDPIVGDNNCQVRAAALAEVLIKNSTFSEEKQALSDCAAKLPCFLNEKLNRSTIRAFLEKNEFIFHFSDDFILIVSCYILSLTKKMEFGLDENGVFAAQGKINDVSFIVQQKKMGVNNVKTLIKNTQRVLSDLSVKWIQEFTENQSPSLHEKDLQKNLKNEFIKRDEVGRACAPFFPSLYFLLNKLQIERIPIVLNLGLTLRGEVEKYDSFCLIYSDLDRTGCLYRNKLNFSNEAAVVIQARSITEKKQSPADLRKNLSNFTIRDLILANGAAHPQYPHRESSELNGTLLEKYSKLAQEKGLCRHNPSLCLIYHVYCDLI